MYCECCSGVNVSLHGKESVIAQQYKYAVIIFRSNDIVNSRSVRQANNAVNLAKDNYSLRYCFGVLGELLI
jgi:hypothetical protein